jgi:hypothetical protein
MSALREDIDMIEQLRIHTSEKRGGTAALVIQWISRGNITNMICCRTNGNLAGMFHMGEGKRTKGKWFTAMPNDGAEEDMVVKLAPDTHYARMIRL